LGGCYTTNRTKWPWTRAVSGRQYFVTLESSAFRLAETDDVYGEWRRLVIRHGVSGKNAHDARIVAAIVVNRIDHILTFNVQDFARYSNLTVLDPSKL